MRAVGSALAGALVLPDAPGAGWTAEVTRYSSLFTLGVCSGDPLDDGFNLWTRLAPAPLDGGGMGSAPVAVRWEVATDPLLRHPVAAGTVTARAEHGHSVLVPVRGLLPDRWYYYRFSALGEHSRIGRSRTFPARGLAGASRMRFALASCQHYEDGYFAAYRDMLEQDLDFVLHVGDYIYETPADPAAPPERRHRGPRLHSLESYRNRYALYRLDAQLQDAHAAYPFVMTWDDHEVADNYAGLDAADTGDRAEFAARRTNAYRAWREAMPVTPRARLVDGNLNIHRRLHFGDLATLHLLDTRQYRTRQPCNDALPALEALCHAELDDPTATMLGAAQERWLHAGLRASRSRWNVLAQQVMMTQWDIGPIGAMRGTWNPDAWDGYRVMRQRLQSLLATARPSNPVVLSGDIHSAWAADIRADFADPASPTVATEFVCTGISSRFHDPLLPLVELSIAARNPHVRFFEGRHRGYCLCEVDDDVWRTDFRAVARVAGSRFTVASPALPVSTIHRVEVPAGGESGMTLAMGGRDPRPAARRD